MTATITSKGQITIPLGIRKHLGLKPGDKLEFDEAAPILTARRAVNRKHWRAAMTEWQKASSKALKDHPWADADSKTIIDELRGGVVDPTAKKRHSK